MRAPFRQKSFILELGHCARRKGHAIAHTPRSAPPERVRGASLWGIWLYRCPDRSSTSLAQN
jgi:hypothetical protein